MQLSHAISALEDAVDTQLRVAGPETAELGGQLMAALLPAIRQTLMDVVAMAATEVSGQLSGQRVEVRLIDGDPELAVVEIPTTESAVPPPPADDDEARITLRLPGYLKDIIHSAAADAGDSVNTYVVEVLNQKTRSGRPGGAHHRTTIEL
jgi:predicted HicB family RNase H-like nuclease